MRLLKRINTGSISSLPAIIANVKTIFDNRLYPAKHEYAPTASNPGPILHRHATMAEKFEKNPCVTSYVPASETIVVVVPLTGSKDSINSVIKRINK